MIVFFLFLFLLLELWNLSSRNLVFSAVSVAGLVSSQGGDAQHGSDSCDGRDGAAVLTLNTPLTPSLSHYTLCDTQINSHHKIPSSPHRLKCCKLTDDCLILLNIN